MENWGKFPVQKLTNNEIERNRSMKTGIEIIAEERQRQIDVEGWTYKQDDEYLGGEYPQIGSQFP